MADRKDLGRVADGWPTAGRQPYARAHRGPGGREFEQVVEFTVFERPRCVHTHIVEGPYPVDGNWPFEPDGAGTRVQFVAEGQLNGLMRLLGPIAERMIARQFRGYHEKLRSNLEAGSSSGGE